MPQETKKAPLTQQTYDGLISELAYLEGEGREKIIDEIARARAHGDLSENAEYHAARDQQGMQEARVRQIRHMIENAEIIQGDDDEVVKPGKLVTIRYEGDDESETYLIGLREEKGSGHDILTPDSPIGRVLLGRSTGDTIVASVPAGELRVEIVAIAAP
ncbi:transcription elongation factor GreA [soil metagenome]